MLRDVWITRIADEGLASVAIVAEARPDAAAGAARNEAGVGQEIPEALRDVAHSSSSGGTISFACS